MTIRVVLFYVGIDAEQDLLRRLMLVPELLRRTDLKAIQWTWVSVKEAMVLAT